MRRLAAFLFLVLAAALAAPAPVAAQSSPSFSPTGGVALSVSNSSSRVAFATPGPTALIINTGSNAAYLNFGGSGVTATTSGYLLNPGCSVAYDVSGQGYVAAITASSTTTLSVYTGSGLPTLPPSGCTSSGGGGGGSVTIADGADVAEGATTDAACSTDIATCTQIALSKRGLQKLTTINTTLGTPFQAGGSIGNSSFASTQSGNWNVGGFEFNPSDTPTIQNASYISGNCMGGFQSVTAARVTGGSGILNSVVLSSKGGGTTALTLYIFNSNPSSSTCTDKSTFTLNAADISKEIVKPIVLTPSVDVGGTITSAVAQNIAAAFVTAGDSKIYFAIVSDGTWTPASTTDIVVNLSGPQD
jgi:hypothetical protein